MPTAKEISRQFLLVQLETFELSSFITSMENSKMLEGMTMIEERMSEFLRVYNAVTVESTCRFVVQSALFMLYITPV